MQNQLKYIRILFFILVLTAVSQFAASQTAKFKPEIFWGLNAGMNGSMVFFKPTVNQGFQTGYHGGITFRYISEKNLGVQAELNYIEKGWTEQSNLMNTYSKQLQYIEIPFMTHIYFGNKFRFFFNLGPQISYLIGENVLYDYYIYGSPDTAEQHITDVQNKFDYGFCTALGFSLQIKRQVIQIGIHGSYSLGDIFSNAKKDYFDTSNSVAAGASIAWMIKTN